MECNYTLKVEEYQEKELSSGQSLTSRSENGDDDYDIS